MNGGVISGNEAHTASAIAGNGGCGGGIYIASAYNEIKAGTIENNKADDQGGGCYVASVPYSLCFYNSIIASNTASILGGGVWVCPTGDVKAYIYDGAACYGNTAKYAADAIAIVRNKNRATTILSDRMLGGGPANWYQDGEIDGSDLGFPILPPTR